MEPNQNKLRGHNGRSDQRKISENTDQISELKQLAWSAGKQEWPVVIGFTFASDWSRWGAGFLDQSQSVSETKTAANFYFLILLWNLPQKELHSIFYYEPGVELHSLTISLRKRRETGEKDGLLCSCTNNKHFYLQKSIGTKLRYNIIYLQSSKIFFLLFYFDGTEIVLSWTERDCFRS